MHFRGTYNSDIDEKEILVKLKTFASDSKGESFKSLYSETEKNKLSAVEFNKIYSDLFSEYVKKISNAPSLLTSVNMEELKLKYEIDGDDTKYKRKNTIENKYINAVKEFIKNTRKFSWSKFGATIFWILLAATLANVMGGIVANIGIDTVEKELIDWLKSILNR